MFFTEGKRFPSKDWKEGGDVVDDRG